MFTIKRFLTIATMATVALAPLRASAGSISVSVKDKNGKPVADAVAYAIPANNKSIPLKKTTAIMDQKNMEFVPHVLAVQTGTYVTFPNSDNIFHHVYSFSPAKHFELPLYKGKPASPVVFDKPGVVVLGCNIHDWMLGYIVVLETPYFGKTGADGSAVIADIPQGSYSIQVWHPDLKTAPEKTAQQISVDKSGSQKAVFALTLKPKIRTHRAPNATMNDMTY